MPRAFCNDTDLDYTVQGQGQPLVLIMGLGGSKEAWFFQIGAFRRRYQVITFDNRGVAQTQAGRQSFTIQTMAEDTIALLDHLGIGEAHILGYSLGGIVAQELAIAYPARLKKLILAATVAVGRGSEPATAGIQKAFGLQPGAAEPGLTGIHLEKVMPVLVAQAFNKPAYRLLMKVLVRPYAKRIGLEGLAAQLKAPAEANTLDRLDQIQATTLVITGDADRVIDPAASRLLASRIPHARLVMVEGGSHAFAIELTARFNQEVLAFLDER